MLQEERSGGKMPVRNMNSGGLNTVEAMNRATRKSVTTLATPHEREKPKKKI